MDECSGVIMVRMRTRSVQFSVSQGENPLPNDTLLICEAEDPLSMEARKGELFIIVESQQELVCGSFRMEPKKDIAKRVVQR